MAEAVAPDVPVLGRMERPGRTAARRRRFDERMAAASTTKRMLAAAADLFRGTFVDYGPEEVRAICERLAEWTDQERSRRRGAPPGP